MSSAAWREANRDQCAKKERRYSEANLERKAECQRTYYQANREQITEQKRADYRVNPDRKRAYYEANREHITQQQHAYYQANRNRILERKRSDRITHAYREANRERQRYLCESDITPIKGRKWTAAEDFIALRQDITVKEISCILRRTVHSIRWRRKVLRANQTQPGTGAQVQTPHSKEVTE